MWATNLEFDMKGFQDAPWNAVAAKLPSVVDSPTGSGKILDATIPAGATTDEFGARSEVVPDIPDFKPGGDFYFGLSMFLADGFPINEAWQVVTQWKFEIDGSPPLELDVENGEFRTCGGGGHPDGDKSFCEDRCGRAVGVSRQSVHTWCVRYAADGLAGLVDRSHRPELCPHQTPPEMEAWVCEVRREHPGWGAHRIVHELHRLGGPGPAQPTAVRASCWASGCWSRVETRAYPILMGAGVSLTPDSVTLARARVA